MTYGIAVIALAMVLLGLWSLLSRFRHGDHLERQQVKWLIFALVLWAVSIVLIWGPFRAPIIILAFVTPLFSIVIAVSLLRYRLYAIDIIIKRTLLYGVLTMTLAAVYLTSVVMLQQIFQLIAGQQSPLALVISTLLIAALFTPMRQRIQSFIDRRFYRQKYDAEKTLTRFAAAVRDQTDLSDLTAELLRTVQETMQPEHLSMWLKDEQQQ
jgi:hypothetical protein